jgi:hypothetical protein
MSILRFWAVMSDLIDELQRKPATSRQFIHETEHRLASRAARSRISDGDSYSAGFDERSGYVRPCDGEIGRGH